MKDYPRVVGGGHAGIRRQIAGGEATKLVETDRRLAPQQ
jgi:hypothetical protein